MLVETVAVIGAEMDVPVSTLCTRTRIVALTLRDSPGARTPIFHPVPVVVSALPAVPRENWSSSLLYVVARMTLLALTSPLFVTLKLYVTSASGCTDAAPAAACTRKSGLCPPNDMSPLQSPKMLNMPNTQFLFTMLVLTMLMTLAAAKASPVAIVATPSSIEAVFPPVSAKTCTSVCTFAMFVEEARNAEELYSPTVPPEEPARPEETISKPYSVCRAESPRGRPFTVPDQFPHTRKTRWTDVPPTLVWFAVVKLLEDVYAFPVKISPYPGSVVVATSSTTVVVVFPPFVALAVVVPKKFSSLSLLTARELEFSSGSDEPLEERS